MGKEYWRKWAKAVAVRTVKTMAEAILGCIGSNAVGITDVDWLGALSIAASAGVVCILVGIKGLPEVDDVKIYDLTNK